MRFTAVSAVAAFAGVAAAHSNGTWAATSYVTEVVSVYTTYCPEATQLTHNGVTYTVSEASTVTITNCPCTIVKPVTSSVVTSCATCAPSSGFPIASTGWSSGVPAPYSSYATAPTYSAGTNSASSPVTTSPATTSPIAPVQTTATNGAVSIQVTGFLAAAGALAALLM